MIRRGTHLLAPILVCVALSGCRDAKPRAERPITEHGSAEQASAEQASASDTVLSAPANVVKRYYDAIGAGHYDSAYALWEGLGSASGQTLAQFKNGFAHTERTTATIGDSVHVEAAAGSQYATVPVSVEAVLRSGERQHFAGTYTVRRAMVDGATPEQRTWHIYSAHLSRR